MGVVVTTGATNRAKLQSNHHHQQTNTQLVYDWLIYNTSVLVCYNCVNIDLSSGEQWRLVILNTLVYHFTYLLAMALNAKYIVRNNKQINQRLCTVEWNHALNLTQLNIT